MDGAPPLTPSQRSAPNPQIRGIKGGGVDRGGAQSAGAASVHRPGSAPAAPSPDGTAMGGGAKKRERITTEQLYAALRQFETQASETEILSDFCSQVREILRASQEEHDRLAFSCKEQRKELERLKGQRDQLAKLSAGIVTIPEQDVVQGNPEQETRGESRDRPLPGRASAVSIFSSVTTGKRTSTNEPTEHPTAQVESLKGLTGGGGGSAGAKGRNRTDLIRSCSPEIAAQLLQLEEETRVLREEKTRPSLRRAMVFEQMKNRLKEETLAVSKDITALRTALRAHQIKAAEGKRTRILELEASSAIEKQLQELHRSTAARQEQLEKEHRERAKCLEAKEVIQRYYESELNTRSEMLQRQSIRINKLQQGEEVTGKHAASMLVEHLLHAKLDTNIRSRQDEEARFEALFNMIGVPLAANNADAIIETMRRHRVLEEELLAQNERNASEIGTLKEHLAQLQQDLAAYGPESNTCQGEGGKATTSNIEEAQGSKQGAEATLRQVKERTANVRGEVQRMRESMVPIKIGLEQLLTSTLKTPVTSCDTAKFVSLLGRLEDRLEPLLRDCSMVITEGIMPLQGVNEEEELDELTETNIRVRRPTHPASSTARDRRGLPLSTPRRSSSYAVRGTRRPLGGPQKKRSFGGAATLAAAVAAAGSEGMFSGRIGNTSAAVDSSIAGAEDDSAACGAECGEDEEELLLDRDIIKKLAVQTIRASREGDHRRG